MDEENKEELKNQQEGQETSMQAAEGEEQAAEQAAAQAAAEEMQAEPAQPTEEGAEEGEIGETPAEPKEKGKHGKNIAGIFLGLLVFAGILFFCWQTAGKAGIKTVEDVGILYAKENNLYLFDLKNEPYLVQENISNGGSYNYYYSAWGAAFSEKGDEAYYPANIDEKGRFDLYRRATKDAAAAGEKIDSGVVDYRSSADGQKAAYLKQEKDNMVLYFFNGTETKKISDALQLAEGAYALSTDGAHLMYTVQEEGKNHLYALNTADGTEARELTEATALYAMAEETGILYYVAEEKDSFNIYSYDFVGEPVLAAENATYMEVMANNRDVLYCTVPKEKVLYSELITDDMQESDAALQETEGEAFEAKAKRDEIRKAMAEGEGIQPILQECYILTGGKSVKVADHIISAASAENKRAFITGYQAAEIEPFQLSELEGQLDAVEYAYYMTLAYGEKQSFLADASGSPQVLPGYGVQPSTLKLSANGTHAAYFATNPTTGGNMLMEMELGKAEEAKEIQADVESMAFLGGSNVLGYYYNYNNGVGTLAVQDGEKREEIQNACGIHYAEDEKAVYFITNPDSATGNGTLQYWKNGTTTVIDEDVFAVQYKGNGKLAYIKNYDITAGSGELCYFDGKESRRLDENVTAIFMY